jgi:surface protein
MIDTQGKTTTLYAYQNGIGASTEAILTRTLRHILYGDLYVNGGNGGGGNGGGGNGGGGEIPPYEMHFTTLAGSVDYVGTQGDQILLSNGTTVLITATDETVTFNAPSGKHKVKLVESVGRNNYVSVGGEALVELHNFPTLSTVTKFNFATYKYIPLPNLTKVPNFLPSNIINISGMFYKATNFNQDISMWDVSNVTNMGGMFRYASAFNQDLNSWNVSSVTNMFNMFNSASAFNQPLNNWNVSSVTNMVGMFNSASAFNQPLNNWNVSSVTDMSYMFNSASAFNQPLNNWNVSSVTDMSGMFIGGGMRGMFRDASAFNQDLSMWCVSNFPDMPDEFSVGAPFLMGAKLPVWGTCPTP